MTPVYEPMILKNVDLASKPIVVFFRNLRRILEMLVSVYEIGQLLDKSIVFWPRKQEHGVSAGQVSKFHNTMRAVKPD